MSSLKSKLLGLAEILGTTESALYERQRSLIRSGLMETEPGRGPGSGARFSAYTLAPLIISMMAQESLTDSATAASKAMDLPSRSELGPERWTFGHEIVRLLADPHYREGVTHVIVERTLCRAMVSFSDGAKPARIFEADHHGRALDGIVVTAGLSGKVLTSICALESARVMDEAA